MRRRKLGSHCPATSIASSDWYSRCSSHHFRFVWLILDGRDSASRAPYLDSPFGRLPCCRARSIRRYHNHASSACPTFWSSASHGSETVRDQGVGGSNPLSPTITKYSNDLHPLS